MLILAYFIHPGLNSHSICDISWVFALYMESLAILPQIHLFTKRGKLMISIGRGNY